MCPSERRVSTDTCAIGKERMRAVTNPIRP